MQFAKLIEANGLLLAAFVAAQKVEGEPATMAYREAVVAITTFRIHLASHCLVPFGSNDWGEKAVAERQRNHRTVEHLVRQFAAMGGLLVYDHKQSREHRLDGPNSRAMELGAPRPCEMKSGLPTYRTAASPHHFRTNPYRPVGHLMEHKSL